LRNEA